MERKIRFEKRMFDAIRYKLSQGTSEELSLIYKIMNLGTFDSYQDFIVYISGLEDLGYVKLTAMGRLKQGNNWDEWMAEIDRY